MLVSTLARVAVALQFLTVANASGFVLRPVPRDDATPMQVRLAYHGPTGMTVSWNTYSQLVSPTVRYGLSASALTSSAQSNESVTYQSSTTFNNHVQIDGLLPETTYYYQVENDSNTYTFTTAKPAGSTSEFTFAVVVDMGTMGPLGLSSSSGDGDALAPGEINTIQSLISASDEFDFLMHPGDIAYADAWLKEEYQGYLSTPLNTTTGYQVYEQILNEFFDEVAPLSSVKPYMVGVGNHEADCVNGGYKTWTNSICVPGQTDFNGYKNHWRMPGDVSGGVGNFWYSFDYGLVHYVTFDTETDFPNGVSAPESGSPNGNVGSYGNEQLDWLVNDLKNVDRSKTPWVIVAGHRPWYVNGGGNTKAQTAFEAVLNQYNVDVVLNGHTHNYERMFPTATGGVIDPNGLNNPSAPWYILNGIAGHYDGQDKLSYPLEDYIAFAQDSAYGWSKFTVHNCTHLTHEFVASSNNSILDSATLYKSREVSPCEISSSIASSSTASSVASSSAASSVASSSAVSSVASSAAASSVASSSAISSVASSAAVSSVASSSAAISSVASLSAAVSSVASSSAAVSSVASSSAASVLSSVASSSAASVLSSVASSAAPSSASYVANNSSTAATTTSTVTNESTTIVTITSCADNKCSETTVPATWGPTTVTENGVVTEYTTWCPETATAASSVAGTETVTDKSTTVVTVTSCSDNKCSETTVPATWGPTTVTENGVVTEYTTWCPESASFAASSVTPVTASSFTTKSAAPSSSGKSSSAAPTSISPSVTTATANAGNMLSVQNAFVAALALLAF